MLITLRRSLGFFLQPCNHKEWCRWTELKSDSAPHHSRCGEKKEITAEPVTRASDTISPLEMLSVCRQTINKTARGSLKAEFPGWCLLFIWSRAAGTIKHRCAYKGRNAFTKAIEKKKLKKKCFKYLQWSCNLLKIPPLPVHRRWQILSTGIGRYSWCQAGCADHSSVRALARSQTVHPEPRCCQIYIPKRTRSSNSPQNVDRYTALGALEDTTENNYHRAQSGE